MEQSPRKIIIISSILGIVILSTCFVVFLLWRHQQNERWKPGILMNEANEIAQKGDLKRAQALLKEALEKEQKKADLHWLMATVTSRLGNSSKAQSHALKAWKNGKVEKDVFNFLVLGCGLDTLKGKIAYGRRLLKDITEKNLRLELTADMHNALKEYDLGLKILLDLYEEKPTKTVALKIALGYFYLNQKEDAVSFLNEARKNKMLDAKGYLLLCRNHYLQEVSFELNNIFIEARNSDNYDDELAYFHGFSLTSKGKLNEAEKILKELLLDNSGKPINTEFSQ
ncbi:MAG: hypothetical protein HRT88_20095, partial [Lentisphaeraceae bacterium]|nr:hypothetical protein [Lentisphaeraceae bacterium]